mgnify:CR=1 FL=1
MYINYFTPGPEMLAAMLIFGLVLAVLLAGLGR